MQPWQTNLAHQLEELYLIRCSLLPGERFNFVLPPEDFAIWSSLLDAFTDAGGVVNDEEEDSLITSLTQPPCQARFEIRFIGVQTWFEVALSRCTDAPDTSPPVSIAISVKGEDVSREAHERWNTEISARIAEIDEACSFPAYEVLAHLTAALHTSRGEAPSPTLLAVASSSTAPTTSLPAAAAATATRTHAPYPPYHALLTSHHLISTTKRRTMHHLASHLDLTGFAKVGYPGIIYAEGPQEGVEAFVAEIKAMQWLALRVRFVEAVVVPDSRTSSGATSRTGSRIGSGTGSDGTSWTQGARWVEVAKIGEVLELMRMRGREGLVTDLGIGAPSKEAKPKR